MMSFETLPRLISQGAVLTPMMEQYYQIKKEHTDVLLLFRMGDFYEVFFEDAALLSKTLNLTLTSRGNILNEPIPMAGIPQHVLGSYVEKLALAGLRVAICDQTEDPKMRQGKGIVKRAMTGLISPGLPYLQAKENEDPLEQQKAKTPCYLAACDPKNFELILIDTVQGEMIASSGEKEADFLDFLYRYQPKEMITYQGQFDESTVLKATLSGLSCLITQLPLDFFDKNSAQETLKLFMPSILHDEQLISNPGLLSSLGALARYIKTSWQGQTFYQFSSLKHLRKSAYLFMNTESLYDLEIILPKQQQQSFQTTHYQQGLLSSSQDHLFGIFNQTQTACGQRLLWQWFHHPLSEEMAINERLEWIDFFCARWELLSQTRKLLEGLRDIRRILTRASQFKVSGQDLICLKNNALILIEIKKIFDVQKAELPFIEKGPETIQALDEDCFKELSDFAALITTSLNEELGASLDKGNLIKPGFHSERDQMASMQGNVQGHVQDLEKEYRARFQLPTLKIKYNHLAGHFIEISKQAAQQAPDHFHRFQTLTNVERFTTSELKSMEQKFQQSNAELRQLEYDIFTKLIERVLAHHQVWYRASDQVALLDVLLNQAYVAKKENLVRPTFHAENATHQEIQLKQAWHPIVQKQLGAKPVVKHDLSLPQTMPFALLTGPNMAGKTTVMKEVAICQYLGLIGSFVPAKVARLVLLDAIFTRLGAGDNLAKGQSTFMVEMVQTAHILRRSTKKSLVILDELGRGTSTYDGLGLAWAISEKLAQDIKCFTLFSTHYHELVELVKKIPSAKNYRMNVLVDGQSIQFLYQLVEGGATESFGHHVARLAGIDEDIVTRAQNITELLEVNKQIKKNNTNTQSAQISSQKDLKKLKQQMLPKQLSLFDQEAPQTNTLD